MQLNARKLITLQVIISYFKLYFLEKKKSKYDRLIRIIDIIIHKKLMKYSNNNDFLFARKT